jgi:predicted RNA binding protein YcfA (HicA-like mRNA interferase family)
MPISRKEIIRKFKKLGFSGPYSGGKHQFVSKGSLKVRIPNPHKAGEISDFLLKEILRQAGIEYETWQKA